MLHPTAPDGANPGPPGLSDRIEQWLERAERVPPRRWLWGAALLLVAWYGSAVVTGQSAEIAHSRTFWLHDDMMISLRYARNWAAGYGPVWNPGAPPVEGYSNAGWVAVMAVIHRLGTPPAYAALAVQSVNIALALVVLVLVARLTRRLAPQPGVLLPAILLAVTLDRNLARWAVLGLENTLLTALFLWLLLRVLDEADRARPTALTFVLLGVLGVIRVDGIVPAAVLALLALWRNPQRAAVVRLLPLAALLPAAHVALRLAYYGHPLPNTYYLKVTGWPPGARLSAGARYLLAFAGASGWLWLLGGAAAWRRPPRPEARALWWLGVPLLLYAVYVGGDDFSGQRLLAVWTPVVVVLGLTGTWWLCEARWPGRRAPRTAALLLVGALFLARNGYQPLKTPGFERELAHIGQLLAEETQPSTVIGVFWAGTTPYFAQRPAVDLLGKNDAVVARLPARSGSAKPGHNKFDFAYSLGVLRPDLVVAPFHPAALRDPATLQQAATGDDAYVGQLYLDATFRAHYAGDLFFVGDVPIFVRGDSAEIPRLMHGACTTVTEPSLVALGLVTVCWPFGK